jgi:hypothetical protein
MNKINTAKHAFALAVLSGLLVAGTSQGVALAAKSDVTPELKADKVKLNHGQTVRENPKLNQAEATLAPIAQTGTGKVSFWIPSAQLRVTQANLATKSAFGYQNVQGTTTCTNMETGTLITVEGFDWSRSSHYEVLIGTDQYLLRTSVDQSQADQQVPIDVSGYEPVDLDVSFAQGGFVREDLNWTALDADGVPIADMYVPFDGMKVAPGTYNLQLTGTDDNHGFDLYKKNVTVSPDNHSVEFGRDEVSELNLIADASKPLQFTSVSVAYWDGYNSSYSLDELNGRQLVYMSNFVHDLATIYETPDNWSYEMATHNYTADQDRTLLFGTDFTTTLEQRSSTFGGMQLIADDDLSIRTMDRYGNRLFLIWDPTYSPVWGQLTLSNAQESYSYEVFPGHTQFSMPDTTGTFDLEYEVTQGPLHVPSVTGQLSIEAHVN